MKKELTIVVSAMLIAAPAFALVTAADGPNENSEFGRCTAQENSEEGNNESNGTVQDTPAFENLSEATCDNATQPGNGSNDSNDSGLSDLPDQANENAQEAADNAGDGSDNAGDNDADEGEDNQDDNADDGSDNADDGSDNADDGSDNGDDGSDNADDGSDNADDNADENAPDGQP